jgi:hypothetical protein
MTLSPPGASPGGGSASRSFQDEVCEIREDLDIWRLAVRRAGSFDLAEDALQDTFYAVAQGERSPSGYLPAPTSVSSPGMSGTVWWWRHCSSQEQIVMPSAAARPASSPQPPGASYPRGPSLGRYLGTSGQSTRQTSCPVAITERQMRTLGGVTAGG